MVDIFNMGNKVWMGILMGRLSESQIRPGKKILRGNVWEVYQGKEVFNLFRWKSVRPQTPWVHENIEKQLQGDLMIRY